jgi:hypothetical protein
VPAITFGKYGSRDELEQAVIAQYRQGDTMRAVGLRCQIHTRSVQRILVRHGIGAGERLPGVRPKKPTPNQNPAAGSFNFVGSPCWRVHCDDEGCVYHQAACG